MARRIYIKAAPGRLFRGVWGGGAPVKIKAQLFSAVQATAGSVIELDDTNSVADKHDKWRKRSLAIRYGLAQKKSRISTTDWKGHYSFQGEFHWGLEVLASTNSTFGRTLRASITTPGSASPMHIEPTFER
jgi:hypothetical protein